MANLERVEQSLKTRGFEVSRFATAAEAADYFNGAVDGKTVGFGGSMTLKEMGLYEKLGSHNEVHWHWENGPDERIVAMNAQVYFSSVNGLAETGEIINIDGAGNRVAATLFGHEKVYLVVGSNKVAPTYDEALWRARNIAAPKNAQRLKCDTPCAIKADRCYDCKSPGRVCRGLVVLWEPIIGMPCEVVLIDEALGY